MAEGGQVGVPRPEEPVIRLGGMMRVEVMRNAMRYAGERIQFHLARLVDEFRRCGIPELVTRSEDPEVVILLCTLCVRDNEFASQKEMQSLVQTVCCGFTDEDLPPWNVTLQYITRNMRAMALHHVRREMLQLPAQGGAAAQFPLYISDPEPEAGQPYAHTPSFHEINEFIIMLKGDTDYKEQAVKSLTCGILMYTKQGSATPNVISKVTTAIRDKLGYNMNIDNQVLRSAWSAIQHLITPAKMREAFRLWHAVVGTECQRLGLMINQAGWNSMTNFANIEKARSKYPDAPWGRLAMVIPGDFANYAQAVRTVNGDEYFGYNRDLGDARSTLYPSLSYAAYWILMEVGGDLDLRGFQGVNMRVAERSEIDEILREWRMERTQARIRGEMTQEAREIVRTFAGLNPLGAANFVPDNALLAQAADPEQVVEEGDQPDGEDEGDGNGANE